LFDRFEAFFFDVKDGVAILVPAKVSLVVPLRLGFFSWRRL
jgi:hypothetical protein